jgi:UPF0271 protein
MPFLRDRPIDLNADVGEAAGEEPLYEVITSANIACGGHAGDDATMRDAVRLAVRNGVAIGAHPSYPDRLSFGRVSQSITPPDLTRAIAEQVAALFRIAAENRAQVRHVKPHGALYADAAARPEVAIAVADGVAMVSRDVILVGFSASDALQVWRHRGFRVAAEGFADRAYAVDGTLVPRTEVGALITDPRSAAAQAVRLAEDGRCDTICIHADTPGAYALAAAVRAALEASGLAVSSL